MAITKIEQIYLYTDQVFEGVTVPTPPDKIDMADIDVPAPADNDSAKAIAWLAEHGITDYVNLNYGDPSTHADCFTPLNTWPFIGKTEDIAAFPFVYYTEVHDDLPANSMPMVLLYGLDAIKNSNLSDLYQLGK
jgi:hypothetical protein